MSNALKPGGIAIIGTFAPTGPEKCNCLTVVRHDAASLTEVLGPRFRLLLSEPYQHVTPWKSVREFQFSTFEKISI